MEPTLPSNVPPGTFSDKSLEIIEDTMNATLRECVAVGQFLEQGAVEDAANALQQIRINAAVTQERVERELGLPPRDISAHDSEMLPPSIEIQDYCLRCKRTVDSMDVGPHGEEWVWMLPRQVSGRNLCSDCETGGDATTIAAIQAMDAATQALINRLP